MYKQSKTTKEDEKLIVALAKEGLAASLIGIKFGLRAPEIVQICNKYKVNVKYNRRKQENPDLISMIKAQRYSAGFIASTLRICTSTVRAAQRELGLTYLDATKKRDANIRKITMLRNDGMSTREACHVIGVSVSTYNRLKALV